MGESLHGDKSQNYVTRSWKSCAEKPTTAVPFSIYSCFARAQRGNSCLAILPLLLSPAHLAMHYFPNVDLFSPRLPPLCWRRLVSQYKIVCYLFCCAPHCFFLSYFEVSENYFLLHSVGICMQHTYNQ